MWAGLDLEWGIRGGGGQIFPCQSFLFSLFRIWISLFQVACNFPFLCTLFIPLFLSPIFFLPRRRFLVAPLFVLPPLMYSSLPSSAFYRSSLFPQLPRGALYRVLWTLFSRLSYRSLCITLSKLYFFSLPLFLLPFFRLQIWSRDQHGRLSWPAFAELSDGRYLVYL